METIPLELVGDLVAVTVISGETVTAVTAVLASSVHTATTNPPAEQGWLEDGEVAKKPEPTLVEELRLYWHGVAQPTVIKAGDAYTIHGVRQ